MDVSLTPRAEQQVAALRARERRSHDAFLTNLRTQRCKAMDYRLTGHSVEHLCVAHLAGPLRAVVAFMSAESAAILLVAPHADRDPGIDVYTQLYALAQLETSPGGQRTKPPCCSEDGNPPMAEAEALDDLFARCRALAGAERRRATRR